MSDHDPTPQERAAELRFQAIERPLYTSEELAEMVRLKREANEELQQRRREKR